MLHEIEPLRLNNHYQGDLQPSACDLVCHFQGDKLLILGDGSHAEKVEESLPRVADLASTGAASTTIGEAVSNGTASLTTSSARANLTENSTLNFTGKAAGNLVYLFSIGDDVFWGCRAANCPLTQQGSYVALRPLRKYLGADRVLVFAAFTAYHLLSWYAQNRFCGTCAHPTELAIDERALVCSTCGRRIYPSIQPAVIVGVTHGDYLIMTKYSDRLSSVYALVAGFNEIGETLEQTVEREVMEEVGIRVTNIRYYKSQPWGIARDILSGFFCDAEGSTEIHLDPSELKEARWFRRDEIEGQSDDTSLTNDMMMAFRNGLEPPARCTSAFRSGLEPPREAPRV